MTKTVPPPPVRIETWRALLALAAEVAADQPWRYVTDAEVVGLPDSVSGEIRIGSIIGNARQVLGVVLHRRVGIQVQPVSSLPALAEALSSLTRHLNSSR